MYKMCMYSPENNKANTCVIPPRLSSSFLKPPVCPYQNTSPSLSLRGKLLVLTSLVILFFFSVNYLCMYL